MSPFRLAAFTPPGLPDPSIAIAAIRAGEIGILDLTLSDDAVQARAAIARLTRFAPVRCGLLLDSSRLAQFEETLAELQEPVMVIALTIGELQPASELSELIAMVRDRSRQVWVEVTCVEQALRAAEAGADAIVAKGHEAGGWVGEETAFILLQRVCEATRLPVFVRGGIGLHTAAACAAAGAAGAVLDCQLALTRESRLPGPVKQAIETMDGSETGLVGAELGAGFRLYTRPHLKVPSELGAAALELAGKGQRSAELLALWRARIETRIDWSTGDSVWPVGQDAAFASALAARYRTVAGVLGAVRDSVDAHLADVRDLKPLASDSPLASSHGTRYPIVQGPMTRVSDTAPFAEAVARGGGLPFLALALMRGAEAESLLAETKQRLGDMPWGVGVLGFVPLDLRQEQLAVVRKYKPPFALIAGGRPDQAKKLEDEGIRTYLHVPSPGLLRLFLQDGARRFVFEGRECGGHVGPRSSFVLWESMIEVLLDALSDTDASDCHVLFAGGIHDARSAAMVAAMAAPLARRGVKVGALLGTGYLFTEEAVTTGAIGAVFQERALACEQTVLVESGPGHAVRCVPNPFTHEFETAKQRLHAEGKSAEEIRHELEALNIGRLRVASKGLKRNPKYGEQDAPKLVDVERSEQERDGMFMIGQLASLRRERVTIEQLHREVSEASAERLAQALTTVETEPERTQPAPSRIAIVGMSCILPKAPNIRKFWENVVGKVYAIDEIPEGHWEWRDYFDDDRTARDKIYSKWGGFVDPVLFNPLEFGMPPNSLPSIDPMQLMALLVARDALEDAGYLKRPFKRSECSVILGASGGTGELGTGYNVRTGLPQLLGPEVAQQIIDGSKGILPEWSEDSFAGLLPNVAAGRIANRFDLGGVNYVVDAACASSLTAVHLAVKELESGSTDMVIAGGIDTVNTPFGYMCFSKTQALSPTGVPRTFDANADGIAISEGLAMLVLKRLEDAERDGDRIYAVIQAVGGSSDGKAKGLTAPRPEGQEAALERAYGKAGFDPTTVELFEAHGTGTVVGDRTEALSLTTYLERSGASSASHAVGSVKSMIGHTKATAGVAGLLKVALSLYHKTLPPTLGVTTPNPKARFGEGPLYVNTETRPWIRGVGDHPRRAGVSAFGFGGTNFHAVVEEYTGDFLDRPSVSARRPSELLVWTRPDRAGLLEAVETLSSTLGDGARPELHDLAWTLAGEYEAGWSPDNLNLAIVATSVEDLRSKLDRVREQLRAEGDVDDSSGAYFYGSPMGREGKIAVLFPGQGSQYPNMLADLAIYDGDVGASFETADRVLADRCERALSSFVFPPPAFTPQGSKAQQEALKSTDVAQPALGAADSAIWRILVRAGVDASMVAGHSYGEYVALYAAGVFDERTLALLSEARGRSIIEEAQRDLGTMAAVGAGREAVEKAIAGLGDVWIANLNAPKQTIISGSREAIEKATEACSTAGLSARQIPVSCAFHSPIVAPAEKRLAQILQSTDFAKPSIDVFSNTTGAIYPSEPAEIAGLLARHLTNPVRFADEIEAMYAAGARIFVEAGPKSVLTGLVGSILGKRRHAAISTDQPGRSSVTQVNDALAQLVAHGILLRPTSLFVGRQARTLKLSALVADTREREAPATAWMVDGARAWPASKPAPVTRRAELPATPAPASVTPSGTVEPESGPTAQAPAPTPTPTLAGDPGADQVMLRFQELMNQFLETQGRVMQSYLQGAPTEAGAVAGAPQLSPQFGLPETPSATSQATTSGPAPAAEERVSAAAGSVPAASPAPAEEEHLPTRSELTEELLRIVSDRTGYPPEMLDINADVEAELGIDSIKRVEIISALQRSFMPDGQEQDPEAMEKLTAVKTLGGVVDWIVNSVENVRHMVEQQPGAGTDADASPAPSREQLTEELLRIVSDRTGYPAEMLDLNADVEAELGIDSIKRVEIIGALRRAFFADEAEQDPVAMEELTAVKTLGGVVDWIVGTIDHAAGRPVETTGGAVHAPAESDSSGAPTPATTDQAAGVAAGSAPSRMIFRAAKAPAAAAGEFQIEIGRAVLITDDGAGIASELARRVSAAGAGAAIVRPGHQFSRKESGIYEADLTSEESVRELVEEVRNDVGQIGALVHLLPLRNGTSREPAGEGGLEKWKRRLAEEVRSLFLLARMSAGDLRGRDGSPSRVIATARLDGSWGFASAAPAKSTDDSFFAGHGAISGLVKTLGLEWPDVRCRAMDVGPAPVAEDVVQRIVEEWNADDPAVEVGGGAGARVITEPVASGLEGRTEEQIAITPESVILLTGGARGITAEVAVHLASSYQPRIVLAGRSPLPASDEDPDTAALDTPQQIKQKLIEKLRDSGEQVTVAKIEAESSRLLRDREIRANLRRIREAGSEVRYETVDARDEGGMRQLVDSIREDFGRLDGVIHGAGLIEDKLVEEKSPASWDRVFDTKADSAFVLSRVLDPETLRFLVFFSSAAAAYGNRGQSDYAAANELLNKLAIGLDARWPARVVAMGWGPWATAGMVSPELQKQFAERGIELIAVDAGCRALDAELKLGRKGEAAVVIAGGAWGDDTEPSERAHEQRLSERRGELPMLIGTRQVRHGNTVDVVRTMDPSMDPCLVDHQLDGSPVVPMALALETMAEVAQQGWPDLHVTAVRDLRVLKGIVIEGAPKEVRITARAQADPPHDRVGANVDVEITSVEDHQRHYRATVELSDRIPEPPRFDPPSVAQAPPFTKPLQQAFRDWLFHGPLFLGIEDVAGLGENHVSARIRSSDPARCVAGHSSEPWLIDPVVVDSGLQLVIFWSRTHFDMTPLPSRFERYRRFGSLDTPGLRCFVEARASLQGHSILTSLRFVDSSGRLLGALEDLEASGSRELNRLAAGRGA